MLIIEVILHEYLLQLFVRFLKVLELTSNVLLVLNLLIVEVLLVDYYLFQLLVEFPNEREMIVYMPFVDKIKSFLLY